MSNMIDFTEHDYNRRNTLAGLAVALDLEGFQVYMSKEDYRRLVIYLTDPENLNVDPLTLRLDDGRKEAVLDDKGKVIPTRYFEAYGFIDPILRQYDFTVMTANLDEAGWNRDLFKPSNTKRFTLVDYLNIGKKVQ